MPRIRRGLAASAVILAAGGLVLARTPAGAAPLRPTASATVATGENSVTFSAKGAHGSLALSHTHLLAGGERRFFAELDLTADAAERALERAPLSIAVVLDTSGSMGGEKMEQAKLAVVRLIRDLRDDDEIAFIRYSTDSELVQPSRARAQCARSSSPGSRASSPRAARASRPRSGRGCARSRTRGRGACSASSSPAMGSTARGWSRSPSRASAERGVTISSMGIGLDFDASYMASVARSGRGNFAFVNDGPALASFLRRELEETATTTIESATARLQLPAGVRLVRAVGADAKPSATARSSSLSARSSPATSAAW